MEDSINNLGIVTSDKDVNDLAARHCEDAQVSYITMGFDWFRSFFSFFFFLLWINFYFHLILRCWRHTGPVSSRNSRRCKRESTESGSLRYMRIWSESVQVICWIYWSTCKNTGKRKNLWNYNFLFLLKRLPRFIILSSALKIWGKFVWANLSLETATFLASSIFFISLGRPWLSLKCLSAGR